MKNVFFLFILLSFNIFSQELIFNLKSNLDYPSYNYQERNNNTHILPFFEDFTYTGLTNQDLWLDNNIYVNDTYGIHPLNFGVATFDGLDSSGNSYNSSNISTSGIADNLTSVNIDLLGLQDVYFSFYYQKKGRGDMPETEDSLSLYFKKDSVWYMMWNIVPDSCSSDSLFFKETLLIPDSFYMPDFQFRFNNHASLNGSFDHWHIDNILVSEEINLHQYNDISFSEISSSLLLDYTSIPWNHYIQSPKIFIDSFVVDVSLYNNYNICKNKDYKFDVFDHLNNHIDHYYKGDPPNVNETILPRQVDFPPGFSFIADNSDINCYTPEIDISDAVYSIFKDSLYSSYPTFTIRHVISSNDVDSIFRNNDTLFTKQKFRDWYSYDDGSAEAAYGLNVVGGQIAYKFENTISDTIYAVDIFFDHSIDDLSNSEFQISIFDDNNLHPGNIIFQSVQNYIPQDNNYSHGFYRFNLEEGIYLNNDFYIGFTQLNSNIINLGLDRNNINNDKMFFNVGGGWLNSSCNGCMGSWMIRPVFSSDNLLSINQSEDIDIKIKIYPNPSKGIFNFIFDKNYSLDRVEVLDLLGNVVCTENIGCCLDLSSLSSGCYFVLLFKNNEVVFFDKIILQK